MMAELANRAAVQNTLHLELMNTLQGSALVEAGRHDLDTIEREYRQVQGCDTPAAKAGCGVSVRWLQQTTRTNPPEQVFAQLVYTFELAKADPTGAWSG